MSMEMKRSLYWMYEGETLDERRERIEAESVSVPHEATA